MSNAAILPLIDRPGHAVLFRTRERAVDAAGLLADVACAASALPQHAYVANLCQDRYRFAVGLLAAMVRGQVSVLSGDLSAGVLRWLAQEFPDAYVLTDGPQGVADTPLPQHRIVCQDGPRGSLRPSC